MARADRARRGLGAGSLADQQLGGLIMWVPGGLPCVAAALALFARWMGRPEAGVGWRTAELEAGRSGQA